MEVLSAQTMSSAKAALEEKGLTRKVLSAQTMSSATAALEEKDPAHKMRRCQ